MDSELAEIATVKTLTKAGISGSFTAASSSFSTRVTANEVVTAKTLLSSSAQIASDISGSFTAASASFSTRVTANDAKVSYTDAAVKAKLNAENVVSGSKTHVLSFINVEDGADVTDTSNVTSAGALMDSELAEIATVKALTKAGISGSFTAASASLSTRITTNEAASASFSTRVTANDAKLTANTSNVTSAGALMDSELAEIATVKTLTKAGISGSFTAASASFSTRVTANGAASASFSTRVTSNDAKLTANTSNVTSAGALMDSELAEIATVKALTKAGISGSFTAASASFSTRVTANEAASASFSTRVTANDAKLTANTSNVTSAGALMDSELAEIATVKALTAAGISGSWQGQGFISASQVTENVGGGIISGAAQINSLINDTIAATIVAEIDNDEIPIAKLAEDSISGVALGSNLNNLTVDNATLQLNTGTTYNGSAARTISIKDGGVDSDALADDITVAGDLTVAGSIIHSGDTDTKIAFGTNTVQVDAGGTTVFESSITGSVLPNVHQNIFDTGSAALTANSAIGDIIKMGNSSTVAGGLYYLKGDGTWALAQANAAGTSTGSLAVAVGTNSTTDGMCIRGFVNPFTDPGAGIGSPVYVNDTNPGRMLATAPSSTGDVVRIIGYQYGTDLIYFNPSNDFIIHA